MDANWGLSRSLYFLWLMFIFSCIGVGYERLFVILSVHKRYIFYAQYWWLYSCNRCIRSLHYSVCCYIIISIHCVCSDIIFSVDTWIASVLLLIYTTISQIYLAFYLIDGICCAISFCQQLFSVYRLNDANNLTDRMRIGLFAIFTCFFNLVISMYLLRIVPTFEIYLPDITLVTFMSIYTWIGLELLRH